jgi:hypothetical protein
MSPETRKLLQGKNYGIENFLYGDNWLGTALYYKTLYPGFTDDQCRAMEAFSNGVTPKQYRNLLKKEKRKQQACSGSKLKVNSSFAPQNSYATNPSTNK